MRKIFSLFAALMLSVGLWAANYVITFTSTSKLYPGDIMELMMDNSKWEAFKAQYPEFADLMGASQLMSMGVLFNPNTFLDANGQVLNYTYNYDDATKTGTITFAGELVTIYGKYSDYACAFLSCSSLTSITLPEGLTSIGEYSFYSCRNLTTVNLPASLTTIGNDAFDECLGLTSVNFAAGSQLTTIGMYAFNGCSSLATITIPASVTNIGWVAIRSCTSLTDVYVAWTTTLPTLGNAVFENTPVSTATLHVPAGTTATYAAADQWKDFGNIVEPAPTPVSTTYLDENGETKNIDAWEVKDASEAVTWGTAGETTWYVVKGTNVQLAKGAICAGDVRLILADNAKLTATGWYDGTYWIGYAGIQVSGDGNSLTIYGQTNQTGQLIATGGEQAAGIGGERMGSGSNITINGGKVTATGGEMAAGIGGGEDGSGSNITINGGKVTATGQEFAAGIGGASNGAGYNITINGGEVTAKGGTMAAGIGIGEYGGSSSNIYISDAYILKAGAAADPTDVIAHSSATDMAGTLTQQYVQFGGLATPYTRSMTIDNWATVCLPYAATSFEGADFYKVNYYDASNPSDLKLYIEPVDNLVAGMPYIFQATADVVTIEHAGVATLTYGEEQNFLGLYGSFARKTIAYDGAYAYAAIANNAVNVIASENEITIPACRAYFDMNEVPTTEQPHSAPLRRLGGARPMPTEIESVHDGASEHSDKCTMHDGKYIINGQFVIVKDGKTYNAQGTLVD